MKKITKQLKNEEFKKIIKDSEILKEDDQNERRNEEELMEKVFFLSNLKVKLLNAEVIHIEKIGFEVNLEVLALRD